MPGSPPDQLGITTETSPDDPELSQRVKASDQAVSAESWVICGFTLYTLHQDMSARLSYTASLRLTEPATKQGAREVTLGLAD